MRSFLGRGCREQQCIQNRSAWLEGRPLFELVSKCSIRHHQCFNEIVRTRLSVILEE